MGTRTHTQKRWNGASPDTHTHTHTHTRAQSEERNTVAGCMRGRVVALSLDTYGCRVVQRAVELLEPEHQASVFD